MNKHLIFVVAIGSLLVTCKGDDYSQELATIDSLKKVLVATDSIIESLDPADVGKKAEEIGNNSKFIQFNVNKLKDTLDFNTALLLTEYRQTGKYFKQMKEDFERVDKAIDSANVSLDNLAHDLKNNSLAEGIDAKASVKSESDQVGEMHAFAQAQVKKKQETREAYDTLVPKVNAFVQDISVKLAASQNK
ncbi:MAG TPA: hypothetical protein VK826_04060 [Bacteroidia bacterium]|nr:hypothetical protein [Bacteroidia bacterium]